MPESTIHLATHNDNAVNAAAASLVQLWRRVKMLEDLPLKESDREEIWRQKELIRAYILTIDGIRQGANAAGDAAQAVLEDVTAFTAEVNHALDEAGIA
jgi:hypothetical protein